MKKETEKVKEALTSKLPSATIPITDLLSLGATLLNLAVSNKRTGGLFKGCYLWLVGDSESGKTWSAYTCLAEAVKNKNFADYRIIIDQAEDGALMDIEHFFGSKLASRIEPPSADTDGSPIYSRTLEDFYFHLDDAHKQGTPFIYVLDSHDALDSQDDEKKFDETKNARRKGKKETGSYGTSKAKINSQYMRRAVGRLRDTGSILVVISQSRDNIGFGAVFAPKTAAGGRALKFYAHVEVWTSVAKVIKKKVKGKNRQVGIICKAQVKKNRITGRKRSVEIPIYWSVGIDEVGACVNYLISEGHWKGSKTGERVKAKEFDFDGNKEDLIAKIENEGLEKELQQLVHKVWNEVDEQCVVNRKRRYE